MKRGNDNAQLRSDEVERLNDEESADAGVFARASQEELSRRKIVRPKRSTGGDTSSLMSETASSSNNPLAGFAAGPFGGGFPITTPLQQATTPAAASSNPFGGFTGLTGFGATTTAAATNPVSSTTAPPLPFSSGIKQDNSFGASKVATMSSFSSIPVASTSTGSSFSAGLPFASAAASASSAGTSSGFKIPSAATATSIATTSTSKTNGDSSSSTTEYTQKMTKLNRAFGAWIEQQIAEQPLSIWSEGLKDYKQYAEEIEEAHGSTELMDKTTTGGQGLGLGLGLDSAAARAKESTVAAKSTTMTSSSSSSSTVTFGTQPPLSTPALPPSVGAFTVGVSTGSAPVAPPLALSGAAPFTGFSFGASTAGSTGGGLTATVGGSSTSGLGSGLGLGAGLGAGLGTSAPFSFGGTTSSVGGFGMPAGSSSTLAPAVVPPVVPFTFGAPLAAAAGGASKPFSFQGGLLGQGNQALSSTASGVGDGNENGGDDDEGEPILEAEKVHRNPEDKDEKLMECPCKLWRFQTEEGKPSGEWIDVGKGTFSITKCADNGKQRMLIRNSVGKIVFNAGFYKGMKVEKTPKGNLTFGAVVDASGILKNFMLKVKTEDCDTVLSTIHKAVASL